MQNADRADDWLINEMTRAVSSLLQKYCPSFPLFLNFLLEHFVTLTVRPFYVC